MSDELLTEMQAALIAHHAIVASHTSILRDLLRHLTEEDLIPADKAARIVLNAVSTDLPADQSTGEMCNAARDELVAIATALLSWPGSAGARRLPHPKPDRG